MRETIRNEGVLLASEELATRMGRRAGTQETKENQTRLEEGAGAGGRVRGQGAGPTAAFAPMEESGQVVPFLLGDIMTQGQS